MSTDFSYLFGAPAEPATNQETATTEATAPCLSHHAADPVESDSRLRDAVEAYHAIAPKIAAAQPLQPAAAEAEPLRGPEWIADRIRATLGAGENGFSCRVDVHGEWVYVAISCPPGEDRIAVGNRVAEHLESRGNLGSFDVLPHRDPATVLLRREVSPQAGPWQSAGAKAARFYSDPAYRQSVLDLAGVYLQNTVTKARKYPQIVDFAADERGGTCTVKLLAGMLPAKVLKAETALRQALAAPDLRVSEDGLNPVIHLNTKSLVSDFPSTNIMAPELFVRPRNQLERHAGGGDFVLPLGVRRDGSPILISQAVAPHMGVFGGTGMGKTVLLVQLVQAACLQGAEVILVDAKNGKDLRKIALMNLPGVVHYSAGSEATLHRAVRYIRDEFERRKTLAAALLQEGVEYAPTPLLIVFDEAPAWLDDAISGTDKEAKKAAETTAANLNWIASQAREQKCFILTAGQYAYASAFNGKWKSNTSTLVILGPPSEINRQALFAPGEPRDKVKELGATLTKSMKGRGIFADTETGEIQLFQGYFNPPGEAQDRFSKALENTLRLRRFGWRFPTGSEDGGGGSWQDWTPVSEPSSDDLPVQLLDLAPGKPDPAAVVYDPTSKSYAPGQKPGRDAHTNAN